MVELVTLAQVTLHRAGSMTAHGFASHRTVNGTFEVTDGSADTLRELVLTVAEKNGDSRTSLQTMIEVPAYQYTRDGAGLVFNAQPRHVQYGLPYATCRAFPALKINNRYFELNEVVAGPAG